MSRTWLVPLLLALLAAPLAFAQHGPPPGYTDPVAYAQDHAANETASAQRDPVGYAQGADPQAEAEHAAWLACWTAYDLGLPLEPACAPFFTAPVDVSGETQEAHAEVTQVLDETGATALANETLDAVDDALADPASALQQVERVAAAVVRFLKDAVGFAVAVVRDLLDLLGLGALAVGAGLLGAAEGLAGLALLPLDGLQLAAGGLVTLGGALLQGAGAGAAALLQASAAVGDAVAAALHAVGRGLQAGGGNVASAVQSAGDAVAQGVTAVAGALGDGAQAAAGAVQDAARGLVHEVGGWFGRGEAAAPRVDDAGLPDAGRATDDAEGLLDRLLDAL